MTDEGSAPPSALEPAAVETEETAVSSPEKIESSESEISVPEPESVESPEPNPEPVPEPLPEPPQEPPRVDSVPAASPAASSPPSASSQQPKPSARERMLTVVRARKAERLEKIVALARERGVITNDDVQKQLLVSDATVTRYLNILVVAGRLRRSGHDGGAKYETV